MKEKGQGSPERELTAEATTELVRGEQEAWQRVLGTRVEVKPLPESVTPEARRNLERFELGLRYVPALDLGTLADLKSLGESTYLDELQGRYPNWKHYENMEYSQKRDPKIGRNLEEFYWEQVRDGKVDFPQLTGQWLAVEKMPKPVYGHRYESTLVGSVLGFEDRFNTSWHDAKEAFHREKARLLSDIGLRNNAGLRMLEAHEWNLIANREGWGTTNTYEWTNTEYHELPNTEYRESGVSHRLVVGNSSNGGASCAYWRLPRYRSGRLGFRAAVVIGS